MTRIAWLNLGICLLLLGCSKGKYQAFADASAQDKAAAEAFWGTYQKALADPGLAKEPMLLAPFFSRAVLTQTQEDDFNKRVAACLRLQSSGLFSSVKIKSVKQDKDVLILLVESKVGEVGVPLTREGERLKFSDLLLATGEWSGAVKPPAAVQAGEQTILLERALLLDEGALLGDRLRAAMALAKGRHSKEAAGLQRRVQNPLARLGLSLARVKLEGSDELFLTGFPADAAALKTLAQADRAIFEEMVTKLGNLAAGVEDPPANEILFRVAAAAPPEMGELFGKALYTMAELQPARFANAVKNITKDIENDPVVALYVAELKRRQGNAPQLMGFLKKFSASDEPEEKKLCQAILKRMTKK